jgi:hypothetical protein
VATVEACEYICSIARRHKNSAAGWAVEQVRCFSTDFTASDTVRPIVSASKRWFPGVCVACCVLSPGNWPFPRVVTEFVPEVTYAGYPVRESIVLNSVKVL